MTRVGGGQTPLTSLTSLIIFPAVLNLNIGEQHINKALANVNGLYTRTGGGLKYFLQLLHLLQYLPQF